MLNSTVKATLAHRKFNGFSQENVKQYDIMMATWVLVDCARRVEAMRIEFYHCQNSYCRVRIDDLKGVSLIGNARGSSASEAFSKVLENIGITFFPDLELSEKNRKYIPIKLVIDAIAEAVGIKERCIIPVIVYKQYDIIG